MMNTAVEIAGVKFKNPVMTASGTFGSGMEYSDFVDLNRVRYGGSAELGYFNAHVTVPFVFPSLVVYVL